MAASSSVDFAMVNANLFNELEKIGIKFTNDGTECELACGMKSEFVFEDGMCIPEQVFSPVSVIGTFLDYFLGTSNSEFVCEFLKIMTENGYIESELDFEDDFDDEIYLEDYADEFTLTNKLLKYESTITEALIEAAYVDAPDIMAAKMIVKDNNMVIQYIDTMGDEECDVFYDAAEFDNIWEPLEDDEKEEFTYKKTFANGKWAGDYCDFWTEDEYYDDDESDEE